jgi:hypothetical protein
MLPVHVGTRPQHEVVVLLVLLHGALLLTLLHVLVLVGCQILLFLLVGNGLLLVGLLVLLMVELLVLWQLPVLVCGQNITAIDGGRRAAIGGLVVMVVVVVVVVVLVLPPVVGMLHMGSLQLLVLVGGRRMLHFLADLEMLLVRRLVLSLLVL